MTTLSENPNNNPATTPKSPSDARLKSLKTTLEERWKEFDAATMKEAQVQVAAHPLWGFTDAITERNKDADYKKAKATFDEAMSALSAIKDDTALKNGLESPGRLASVMNTLKDYLANADKQKWYNTVLSHTFADLTTLKAQMTEKAEDKKDAEVARAALPVVTTTASVSPEVSAMGSEVNSMIKEWVNDATKAVTEEVTELKKHPARKIFELMGFTPEDTVSDIKSALSDLKDAKGFDKIGAKFSLFIAIFIGKILGVDFAKWLTPEEMKLAGIKGKVEWGKPKERPNTVTEVDKGKLQKEAENKYTATTVILGELSSKENKDITKVYNLPSLRNLKYVELVTFAEKKDITWLRTRLGIWADVWDSALTELMDIMTNKSHPLYFLLAWSYEKKWVKNIKDATIFDILSSVWSDLKILASIKSIDITDYEASTEKLAKSMLSIDTSGEVSGELVEKSRELGISKNLLSVLLKSRETTFMDKKSLETLRKNQNLSDDDRKKLDELWIFGENFIKTITTDDRVNFGIGSDVWKIHSSGKINLGDMVKSFVLTKGQSSLDTMDTLQRVGLYTWFLMMVWSTPEWSGLLSGKLFNFGNVTELMSGTSIFDKIPLDVRNLLASMFDIKVILKKIKDMWVAMSDHMIWFAKESPAFAAVLILAVIFLPLFSRRTSLAWIFTWRN